MVHGVEVDDQTRCAHWNSASDVIAIRFPCCDRYFACYDCHVETQAHAPAVWGREAFGTKAVLCGGCGTELTIDEYLGSGFSCPSCGARFNPGCASHYHLYFEL
jgi:uncharacterized CHY-type Zn-finger protein